jgi:hypothetical protein
MNNAPDPSGQPSEPVMTSFSNIQSACSPATAAAADTQGAQDEIDWEERRWQMEWDRRNVED